MSRTETIAEEAKYNDDINFFEKPGDPVKDKSFEVFQVLSDDAALVRALSDAHLDMYLGPVYLLTNDEGKYYYDEEKILVSMTLGMMSLFSFAQEIDEMELAGTEWGLTESEGEFVYVRRYGYDNGFIVTSKPDSIYFYNEEQHVEHPESLGIAKYQTEEEYTYYNDNYELIHTGEYRTVFKSIGVMEYFVSNGNKLHILLGGGHYNLRYKVNYYDGETMMLETFDRKGKLTYRKRTLPSDAAAPKYNARRRDNNYYNVSGQKLSREPLNGLYIYEGSVKAKK